MRARVQELTPLERALRLRRLGLLGTLGPEDRVLVTRCVEERRYRRGQFLSVLGEPVSSLHVVIEGRVRRRGVGREDEELGPGATIGLLATLAEAGEEIELEALEDTLTLELSGKVIEAMLEYSPRLLLGTVRDLGELLLGALRDLPDGAYLAPAAEGGLPTRQGALGVLDKVRWLRRSGLLDGHNVDAFLEMANSFDEARFEPGEKLWQSGEASGKVFLLLEGTVRGKLAGGGSIRFGPGFGLGYAESICEQPRWYRAVCETPIVALGFHVSALLEILEAHFELALQALGVWAARVLDLGRADAQDLAADPPAE